MGILNVTPDSFSDGGRFHGVAQAIEQARALTEAGADILDIGGESTRPGSEPVSAEEEMRRVAPVIESLGPDWPTPISIDTSKASVARAALAAGAEIINDVTGLEGDPAMLELARDSGAGVCAMHMRGKPRTMQDDPRYDDVAREVIAYLAARRAALIAAGIAADRVVLDPGIGFGKTHEHNLALLAACHHLHKLGSPIVVGHSRKGFISHVLKSKTTDRLAGGLGVSLALAVQGVQVVRVHDVAETRQAFELFEAAGGFRSASQGTA